MPKYMMLFRGEAIDISAMAPEEVAAEMALWGAWMEQVGPALSDLGSPFGPGTSVVDDGSTSSAGGTTGYSIIEADDMNAAQDLAKGHPYLRDGNGNYAIDLFELMPVRSET
jgi:hypothetical protein